jgi:CRP-like cAMP-binding protein
MLIVARRVSAMLPQFTVGWVAFMSEKPYTMSAAAKRSAVVSYVTRKDFTALMQAEV